MLLTGNKQSMHDYQPQHICIINKMHANANFITNKPNTPNLISVSFLKNIVCTILQKMWYNLPIYAKSSKEFLCFRFSDKNSLYSFLICLMHALHPSHPPLSPISSPLIHGQHYRFGSSSLSSLKPPVTCSSAAIFSLTPNSQTNWIY